MAINPGVGLAIKLELCRRLDPPLLSALSSSTKKEYGGARPCMPGDTVLLATRGMRSNTVSSTYDSPCQDYIHVLGLRRHPPCLSPTVIKFCVFHRPPSSTHLLLSKLLTYRLGLKRGCPLCFAPRETMVETMEGVSVEGVGGRGGTSSSRRSFHESFRGTSFPPLKRPIVMAVLRLTGKETR